MPRRWWISTIAVWVLAALLLNGTLMVSSAVRMRDIGWTLGPWSYLADFLAELSWPIIWLSLLATLLPPMWWRRQDGSLLGTWGLALAGPIAALAPRLIPHGYPEDAFIPLLLLATIIGATLGSAVIVVLVKPRDRIG